MATTKQILKGCQVFSTLGETELEQIANSALEKQYEAGTIIFQEGESAGELLIIQDGQVAVQMTMSRAHPGMSRRITVDVVTGNEVIGWSAIVEPYVYTLTAVCLQKVNALAISGEKLRWLMQDNPKMGYEVLTGLVKVVALRLDDTRRVLVSERLSLLKSE